MYETSFSIQRLNLDKCISKMIVKVKFQVYIIISDNFIILINKGIIRQKPQMNIEQKQSHQFQNLTKIFVFEKQSTFQQEIINCIIRTDKKSAPILHIIQKIVNPSLWRIKIYDNQASKFVDLNSIAIGDQYVIPYKYIQLEYTLFTYSPQKNRYDDSVTTLFLKNTSLIAPNIQSGEMESQNSKNSEPGITDKKQKNKQKTIGQVIQLVKRWRSIHNSMVGKNKISLFDAAKIIGIPKKTLDDYYYYLRIGELKQFDFNENIHEKVGVLRKFVKDNEDKRGKRHYLKHPKNLLMLEGDIQKIQQQVIFQQKDKEKVADQSPSNNNIQDHFNNNLLDFSLDNLKSYEDNFFGEVEQKISENNDPFFNFTNSFLKKKDTFQFDLFFD